MTSTKRAASAISESESTPPPPPKRICLSLGGEEDAQEDAKLEAASEASFGSRCGIAQAPQPHGHFSPARCAEILRPWFWFEHTHSDIIALLERVLKTTTIPSAPFPGFVDTGSDPTRRASPLYICQQAKADGKSEAGTEPSDVLEGWVVCPATLCVKRALWFFPSDKLRLFTCISRELAAHPVRVPHSLLWAGILQDASGVHSLTAAPIERALSRVCVLPALAAFQRRALSTPNAEVEPEIATFATSSRTLWYAHTKPVVHAAVILSLAEFAYRQEVNTGTLSGWVELFCAYVCRQKLPDAPVDSPTRPLVLEMLDRLSPLFAQLHDFLFHAGHTAYASKTLVPSFLLLHQLRGFSEFWKQQQQEKSRRPRVIGYSPRSIFTLSHTDGDELLLLSGYVHSYKRVCDIRAADTDAGWLMICDTTLAEFSHVMVSCNIAHLLPCEANVIAQISRTHHGVEQPCLILFCNRFRARMLCLYSRMLGDYSIADDAKAPETDSEKKTKTAEQQTREQSSHAWRSVICSGVCMAPVYSDIISVFLAHCADMKGWHFSELLRAMLWWAGLSSTELASEATGTGVSATHRAALEFAVSQICKNFDQVLACPDIPPYCFYILAACASPHTRVFVASADARAFNHEQATTGEVLIDFDTAERVVRRAIGEPAQMNGVCRRFAHKATRISDDGVGVLRSVCSTAAWIQSHVALSGFPSSQELWEKHKTFATLAVGLDALAHGVTPTQARALNNNAAQVAVTHAVYSARFRSGVMKATECAFFPRIDNGDSVFCEQFALWMARLNVVAAAVDADLR